MHAHAPPKECFGQLGRAEADAEGLDAAAGRLLDHRGAGGFETRYSFLAALLNRQGFEGQPPVDARIDRSDAYAQGRDVRDLQRSYGNLIALADVSFDIERGETLALLGPNGAGKSTTIEIREGYRDRSGGKATVLGVDPQLGIVLQSTGEPGNVTVREQLAHFAGFYPNPRDIDEVIAPVGLTQKAKTRIRALSGGPRRRVDVALSIISRPQLLLLDEPATGSIRTRL